MTLRRRSVLSLLGLGTAGMVTARVLSDGSFDPLAERVGRRSRPFDPVRVPLPVEGDGLTASEQHNVYRDIALEDRLTLPDGFSADLLAAWGDRLGDSRFGFNNDHLGFVQYGADQASMTVNFEYISALPWAEGFEDVIGQALPFSRLVEQLAPADGEIDCTALPAGDPLLNLIRAVADQAMTDLGVGVMPRGIGFVPTPPLIDASPASRG